MYPRAARREKQPFTLGHFEQWARGLVLDSGKPWRLEPFQRAFVADVFAGFTECWLVVPEGNAKTTLIAGLALYHIRFKSDAWVPVAASSRDQAEILYRQAEGFVFRSELAGFKCLEGYRRIRYDATHSRIQIFAADERTGDGVIPTLGLVDELHRHRDMRLYRTWRGKVSKRRGQIIAISTAGEPGSEFETTRERIRQETSATERSETFIRAASKHLVLHEWAVPEKGDVEDIHLVKKANPLRAVTLGILREKFASPTMTLSHWRRFVCNLPTRGEFAAISEKEWVAARTDVQIPDGEHVWLGLDVAWRWDTTAAVPLWMKEPTFRLLGPAMILTPPRDGTSLSIDVVKRALLSIHKRTPVDAVVIDITKAEDLADWLRSDVGIEVIERTQSQSAAVDDYERFMEALRNGWLKHSGDQGLTRHALNAIARTLPYGDQRFDRPSQVRQGGDQERRVIDALTAAAMVHFVAAGNLKAPEPEPEVQYLSL